MGDTSADPQSTAVPPDSKVIPPARADRLGNVDSGGDEKLTRGECRAWYESQTTHDTAPGSDTPQARTGS